MKVLILTHSYLRGNSGGIYASRTHINLFATLSDKCTVLYPYAIGKEPEGILQQKMNLVPIEDKRSNVHKMLDLMIGIVHRFSWRLVKQYLEDVDTVVFDNSVVSSRLIRRVKALGLRVITIHHNYQIEYLKGDANKFLLPIELFWTWIYEGQSVRNSDLNLTLTKQDALLLKEHYLRSAHFATLGVFQPTLEKLPPNDTKFQGHRYIITGGLADKQTEKSLIEWVGRYYPLLKKFDSAADLTIAGRNPSEKLYQVCNDAGIRLIASPQDMASLLRNADFYICPIDRGGGLKLRNLDGLRMGLPILTHSVSARGYEKMMEEGLVLAYNNPKSFVEGLNVLLQMDYDKNKNQSLYNCLYGFNAGVTRLSSILNKENLN